MSPPSNAKRGRQRMRSADASVRAAVNRDDPFDGIDGATWPWHPTTSPVPSRYLPLREVLGEIERWEAVNAWAFGASDGAAID